jgi:hypothetical protein
MIRFRSWTGGQLVIFSIALAFAGLLLFLSYRTWNAQFWDQVDTRNAMWREAIDQCRSISTERCNALVQPYMDAGMRGIGESYRHRDQAAWFTLSLVLIDLIVIPGILAYTGFQWFGAHRRGNA